MLNDGTRRSCGARLFAKDSIKKDEKILLFNGIEISIKNYNKKILDGDLKPGYAHHINTDTVYSCYASFKKGECKASACNSSTHYFAKDGNAIDANASIRVWRKQSNQPYIIAEKDINADEEIVVKYGTSYKYNL